MSRQATGRFVRAALLATSIGVCLSSLANDALAIQTVELGARFSPNRPGADTTILLDFAVQAGPGQLPSPVSGVDLRLPAGLVFNSSGMGLVTCSPATVAQHGAADCSPESLMGRGSALVGIRLGPEILYEHARVTLLMAPATGEDSTILFYLAGSSPVIAQLVFPSVLLGDSGLFSGRLDTSIPPIAGLPGGPSVSLLRLLVSIGPRGITYYRRKHGRLTGYVPRGFSVPASCPRRGFAFAAGVTFEDGGSAQASSFAPCPARRGRKPRH